MAMLLLGIIIVLILVPSNSNNNRRGCVKTVPPASYDIDVKVPKQPKSR